MQVSVLLIRRFHNDTICFFDFCYIKLQFYLAR